MWLGALSAAASSIGLWRWREERGIMSQTWVSSSSVSRDMGVTGINPSFVSVLGRGDESVISRVRLGCSS